MRNWSSVDDKMGIYMGWSSGIEASNQGADDKCSGVNSRVDDTTPTSSVWCMQPVVSSEWSIAHLQPKDDSGINSDSTFFFFSFSLVPKFPVFWFKTYWVFIVLKFWFSQLNFLIHFFYFYLTFTEGSPAAEEEGNHPSLARDQSIQQEDEGCKMTKATVKFF